MICVRSENTNHGERDTGHWKEYQVLKNSVQYSKIAVTQFLVPHSGEYQVVAIDANGFESSFASEPIDVYQNEDIQTIELENIVIRKNLPLPEY